MQGLAPAVAVLLEHSRLARPRMAQPQDFVAANAKDATSKKVKQCAERSAH